jgi:hypothetical protein
MLKATEHIIKKKIQSCDDGSKGEEKKEVLDVSQGRRKGKGF